MNDHIHVTWYLAQGRSLQPKECSIAEGDELFDRVCWSHIQFLSGKANHYHSDLGITGREDFGPDFGPPQISLQITMCTGMR